MQTWVTVTITVSVIVVIILIIVLLIVFLMPKAGGNDQVGMPTQLTLTNQASNGEFIVSWKAPSFTGNQGDISYNYRVLGSTGSSNNLVLAQQGNTSETSFQLLPFGIQPRNNSTWNVAVQAIVNGATGPQSKSGYAIANLIAKGPPGLLSFTWDTNTLAQDLQAGLVSTNARFDSSLTSFAFDMEMQGHSGISGSCFPKLNNTYVACTYQWTDGFVPAANTPIVWNYDVANSIGPTSDSQQTTTPSISPGTPQNLVLAYQQ